LCLRRHIKYYDEKAMEVSSRLFIAANYGESIA
jgi:hypothetical protein